MMSELFPHRAQIGDDDGADADHWDHRQRSVPKPDEVLVTEDVKVGKLYAPDGRSFRVVREGRRRVPFGFQGGSR